MNNSNTQAATPLELQRGFIKDLDDQICCRSFRANLSELLDGEMTQQEQFLYESHAAGCEDCQLLMDQTARLVNVAAKLGERPIPEKVIQRLRQRLQQEGFKPTITSNVIPLVRRS